MFTGLRKNPRLHVWRRLDWVDQYVEAVIIEWLSRPEFASILFVPPHKDPGEKLRKKERMLRGKLDGLAEAFASNEIDREALRAGSKRAKAELQR